MKRLITIRLDQEILLLLEEIKNRTGKGATITGIIKDAIKKYLKDVSGS